LVSGMKEKGYKDTVRENNIEGGLDLEFWTASASTA
jgi:hypothetical protein